MKKKIPALMAASAIISVTSMASANTAPFFTPLTQSAPVVAANGAEEMNAPWVVPAGVGQANLTSMIEIEGDPAQSVGRAPGAGTQASMWDMVAYDVTGRFVFIPHESPFGAGVSRYDTLTDETQLLFSGNNAGANGNWSNDWGAFDPATFTPMCTVMAAEEWTAEGRLLEILNPYADRNNTPILVREVNTIANVAHEGLRFSADGSTLYFVDEWNSGSIYKFVMARTGDLSKGQTFVLVVDAFVGVGDAVADYNQQPAGTVRTGAATWVPITDANGVKLTVADPFRNGPTDFTTNPAVRGGRPAADEVNGTPYGRPEDMEIAKLANGNEVMYVTATSENAIYTIEMLPSGKADVRVFASAAATGRNVGFAQTTGTLNSPDNLAQDAAGNIYVIEDAPNGSSTGGDIWFVRDVDNNGVAESLDHFLSIRVAGSEATGMIFDPIDATKFVVAVQHPNTTDLTAFPDGFGDALWQFDISTAAPTCAPNAPPSCLLRNVVISQIKSAGNVQRKATRELRIKCTRAMNQQTNVE